MIIIKNRVGFVSPATGVEYDIDGSGLATAVPPFDEAEAEDERRAEFAMSWVCGGGRREDAGAAYQLIGAR